MNYSLFSEHAATKQILGRQVLFKKVLREQELNPRPLGSEPTLQTTQPSSEQKTLLRVIDELAFRLHLILFSS